MNNDMTEEVKYVRKVNIRDLEGKFKSKKEIYVFLMQDCKAYMPSLDSTNVYFLKEVLKGEKEVS